MLLSLLKKRVLVPLRISLKNGVSHQKLAVSLALGITIGIIPFYGLTTLLVGTLAIALRLDFVVMQVVHYVVHPLQIALLIPFLKISSHLLSSGAVDFTVMGYISYFRSNFWLALNDFWKLNLLAIAIWFILSIPLFILLYKTFYRSIGRFAPVLVRKPFCKVK
jgi:hypothetical protein